MDLYIYYRARCENAQLLQARVRALQTSISEEYGIVTELKRRPEEKDGRHTWMEVYRAVPQEFAAALERSVAQARLGDVIDGPRHTEIFLDYTTCA